MQTRAAFIFFIVNTVFGDSTKRFTVDIVALGRAFGNCTPLTRVSRAGK
jgi:hypothetical protein